MMVRERLQFNIEVLGSFGDIVQFLHPCIYRLQQLTQRMQLLSICFHLQFVARFLSKTQQVPLFRSDISQQVTLGVDIFQMQVLQIIATWDFFHSSEIMTSSDFVAEICTIGLELKEKVASSTNEAFELRTYSILSHFRECNTDGKGPCLSANDRAMEIAR